MRGSIAVLGFSRGEKCGNVWGQSGLAEGKRVWAWRWAAEGKKVGGAEGRQEVVRKVIYSQWEWSNRSDCLLVGTFLEIGLRSGIVDVGATTPW